VIFNLKRDSKINTNAEKIQPSPLDHEAMHPRAQGLFNIKLDAIFISSTLFWLPFFNFNITNVICELHLMYLYKGTTEKHMDKSNFLTIFPTVSQV